MAKFISCKKSVEVRGDGDVFPIPAGYIGQVPDWVEKHWFFEALCKDGTITAIVSTKDSALEEADAAAKAKAEAADKAAEKKRLIDQAKADAEAAAKVQAEQDGLDVAATKKLVKESVAAAIEEVTKQLAAQ